MIVEKALALAGPSAVLAGRPGGVAHIVTLTRPLTRTGRIPRSVRPVCNAHTRTLRPITIPPGWSSLRSVHAGARRLPRVCARCSACLSRRAVLPRAGAEGGQAEQHPPVTRDQLLARYADVTPADLWAAAQAAATADELDQVAHLSLALFGHRRCTHPVHRPDGRAASPLHDTIAARRQALDPNPTRYAALDEAIARSKDVRAEERELTRARRTRARDLPITITGRL